KVRACCWKSAPQTACALRRESPTQVQRLGSHSGSRAGRLQIPHRRGRFHRLTTQSVVHLGSPSTADVAAENALRKRHLLLLRVCLLLRSMIQLYRVCRSIYHAAIVCKVTAWNIPTHTVPSTHPSLHNIASGSILVPSQWR